MRRAPFNLRPPGPGSSLGRRLVGALLLVSACNLQVYELDPATATGGADGSGTSTGTSYATTSSTTTSSAAATSTGLAMTTTGSPASTGSGGVEGSSCDIYAQDCADGLKCAWTAPPGETYWQETTCVPLAPVPLPPGAPCAYDLDNPVSGIDECGIGTECVEGYYEPGMWDGQGTCKSFCLGSGEHPYCEPGAVCIGGRALWLCTPMCDPLVQDCAPGNRCDLYGASTICTWDWPEEPRTAIGQPCDWPEECELGATCLPAAFSDCGGSSCCTPFCDRTDPQATCPLPGQECLAPWDLSDELAGAEAVGVCRPEAWP